VTMDPAVKTAMAFCVLLAGVCAALLFRRDPSVPPPAPNAAELLLIRHRLEALGKGQSLPAASNSPLASSSRRAPTVLAPWESQEPPPPLADSYPQGDRPASARWGMSMDMLLPAATPTDQAARSHKIVDGDTLGALAERYLGSAARAQEIFEANRNVLVDPELLPIGVELKIPARVSQPAGSNSEPWPQRPLAPVR
jgi:nucleoid-associated protein YgaU